jgi:hypothetical protein
MAGMRDGYVGTGLVEIAQRAAVRRGSREWKKGATTRWWKWYVSLSDVVMHWEKRQDIVDNYCHRCLASITVEKRFYANLLRIAVV